MPARPNDLLPADLREAITLSQLLERSISSPSFSPMTSDEILAAVESEVLVQSFDSALIVNSTDYAQTQSNREAIYTAVLLREAAEVSGVASYVTVAGVYTADNNNKVGLYALASDGLSLERVAQSANDGNLWKSTGMIQKAFTAPVSLAAGIYWVAMLWNGAVGVTTNPALASLTPISQTLTSPLPGSDLSRMWKTTSTTDLPATQAISGLTLATSIRWHALY